MSRWKTLPGSLDPRVRQFVVRLRRLKDHSGLGLATLAQRTGYSRSSWDRYLNGKALPPAEAVEALARVCEVDPARPLAQREVAAEAWGGEQPPDPSPEAGPLREPGPASAAGEQGLEQTQEQEQEQKQGQRQGRRVPWLAIVLSSVTTALVMLAVLAVVAPWEQKEPTGGGEKPYTGEAHPEFGEFTYDPGKHYPCEVKREKDGRLYAGYSRTQTELIVATSTRWSVVEAQCLLKHHEEQPGAVDGAFGNATERAVKRLQRSGGIAVDGKVGPDTWKVLRK